jgi:hypothetical protein
MDVPHLTNDKAQGGRSMRDLCILFRSGRVYISVEGKVPNVAK